ncbi:MAG TPA: hypothetical protein VK864_20740 [Longimicrobiales bacterium]|nr:hypothetical protein [Longimicrobiales bacterium]
MAEIRVERKRGIGAWVWVLLAIIVILAVLWYLATNGYIDIPGITTALNGGAIEWQRNASAAAAMMRA